VTTLLGIRCVAGGHLAFPVADRGPVCTSRDVHEVALAAEGTVEAATGAGDVTIGEVRLDDGVLVLARVVGGGSVGDRVRYAPEDGIVRFERT
jgi:uncharacterized OB-fold protein